MVLTFVHILIYYFIWFHNPKQIDELCSIFHGLPKVIVLLFIFFFSFVKHIAYLIYYWRDFINQQILMF